MPSFGATFTGAQLLSVVRYEREVLSGATIDPKQVDADGSMLWPDGKPMLDATGALITPDGKPLFDTDGKLTDRAQLDRPGGWHGLSPRPR